MAEVDQVGASRKVFPSMERSTRKKVGHKAHLIIPSDHGPTKIDQPEIELQNILRP